VNNNATIANLIEHINSRPAPPQKSATKETFVKFAGAYSKWLIKLDTLTAAASNANKHYSLMTNEEAREAASQAEAVLSADYRADIRGIVEEIKSELKTRLEAGEGGEPLREWLIEHIEQTIDGHHNVIYTAAAQRVLLFSDNSGAYVDDFGDEGLSEGGDIAWNRLAWAAMRADVNDLLDANSIDVNEPDSEGTRDALGLEPAEEAEEE
jgi:hypothetical protein